MSFQTKTRSGTKRSRPLPVRVSQLATKIPVRMPGARAAFRYSTWDEANSITGPARTASGSSPARQCVIRRLGGVLLEPAEGDVVVVAALGEQPDRLAEVPEVGGVEEREDELQLRCGRRFDPGGRGLGLGLLLHHARTGPTLALPAAARRPGS